MTSYHENVRNVLDSVNEFFRRNFTEIVFDGPEIVSDVIKKNPVMLVSTHRSHLDYFLVGYQFSKLGFKNLRFAAGSNLTNLPYVGSRFKSFGAFAVERDTGFERNYVRNLCGNVVTMMENGDVIIVFPEGGRSYTGAMLEIKSGILAAAILTNAKRPDIDVQLLPITVCYEYPPDLSWFKLLLKGKMMRKRNCNIFKKIIGTLYYFGADLFAFTPLIIKWFPKKKFGRIYVDYDVPVGVSTLVDIQKNRVSQARDEFSAHRMSMQTVSNVMYEKLHKLYRILPQHIVAAIIKTEHQVTVDKIQEKVDAVCERLRQDCRNCKTINTMNKDQIVLEGIEKLTDIKAVKYKAGAVTVCDQNVIDYFAATI